MNKLNDQAGLSAVLFCKGAPMKTSFCYQKATMISSPTWKFFTKSLKRVNVKIIEKESVPTVTVHICAQHLSEHPNSEATESSESAGK